MQGLRNIITKSFANRSVLSKQVQASLIVEQANNLILEYWGKKGQEQAKAQFIKNKILNIITQNSAMAQEIRFKQSKFIEEINKKYKNRVLNQLRIVSGGFDKDREIS